MCNILGKQRKENVEYRNVRLSIDTYDKLDRYVLELVQKRADRRISIDEAVESLIDEYYSKRTKKET